MMILILFCFAILAFACTSRTRENIENKNVKDAITLDMMKKEFEETLEFEKRTDELIRKWKKTDQI